MERGVVNAAAVGIALALAACTVAVEEPRVVATTERVTVRPGEEPRPAAPPADAAPGGGLPVTSMVLAGVPRAVDPASRFRLFVNRAFAAGWSDARGNPLWVGYYVFPVTDPLSHPRPRGFAVDPRTNARPAQECYAYSGWARGQHAPARTIGSRYGADAQRETFLMSNVSPRAPRLHQETWRALERLERDQWAQAWDLWVVTGPIFDPSPEQMSCGIQVPNGFYKILVSARDPQPAMLAVIMTQEDHGRERLGNFATTVDEIEALTGLDFFHELPDEVEALAESSPADERWNVEQMLTPVYRSP